MTSSEELQRRRELAERVRAACIEAALAAYEDAATSGLCGEGAWECAVGAVRELNLEALLETPERTG